MIGPLGSSLGCFDLSHVVYREESAGLERGAICSNIFSTHISFRQAIFTVVSITLDSIKQKCKTNDKSSGLHSGALPSQKSQKYSAVYCLSLA